MNWSRFHLPGSELILYLGLHKKSINAWTARSTKQNAKVFPRLREIHKKTKTKRAPANRQRTCIFLASFEGRWIRTAARRPARVSIAGASVCARNPDSTRRKVDRSCVFPAQTQPFSAKGKRKKSEAWK